jgi:hypothetical protein
MANTMTLIASSTVGSGGAANFTFNSIPSTYTDLCVKISPLGNATEGMYIQFNGSTANFTGRYMIGDGTSATSGVLARYLGSIMNQTTTPNNTEIYIPNYAGSNNKSFSIDEVQENNASGGYQNLIAGLWSSSSAITSITIEAASNFRQYTTAYLYGIKNS